MTLPFVPADCRQMEALLPPYVDGEATATTAAAVEAHLASCAACRASVVAQREIRALLVSRRAGLVEPAPALLTADVRRAASATADRAGASRWSPLAAAAVVVLAVTGGFAWATGQSSVLLAAQLTLDHLKCFVIDGEDRASGLSADEGRAHFHDDFGMDVQLPSPAPGGRAKLVSVRQCLYGSGLIAHALYRVDGEAVSLFVLDDPHAAASVDAFGRHAEVVSRGARTYVIVAPGRVRQVAGALGLEAE